MSASPRASSTTSRTSPRRSGVSPRSSADSARISSSPRPSRAWRRPVSVRGRGRGRGRVRTDARAGTVRDALAGLADIFRRCDPPMWKHVQLLGSQECMFAFRAVVVLLARELPPDETAFLWEALMAAGDHLEAGSAATRRRRSSPGRGGRAAVEGKTRGRQERTPKRRRVRRPPRRPPRRLLRRLLRRLRGGAAAAPVTVGSSCTAWRRRSRAGATRGVRGVEFDDLLRAAHHAVAAKCVAAAPLLASARRLAAQS